MRSGFTPNVTLSGPITCLITHWICLRSMPQKWRRRLAAVGKLNLRYPVFWRANLNLFDGAPANPFAWRAFQCDAPSHLSRRMCPPFILTDSHGRNNLHHGWWYWHIFWPHFSQRPSRCHCILLRFIYRWHCCCSPHRRGSEQKAQGIAWKASSTHSDRREEEAQDDPV